MGATLCPMEALNAPIFESNPANCVPHASHLPTRMQGSDFEQQEAPAPNRSREQNRKESAKAIRPRDNKMRGDENYISQRRDDATPPIRSETADYWMPNLAFTSALMSVVAASSM